MLVRWVDRFPGGRAVFLLMPWIAYATARLFLSPTTLIQVMNVVICALSLAVLFSWRDSLRIFFEEQADASRIWLSYFVFVVVAMTAGLSAYSAYLRAVYHYGQATEFLAFTKVTYAASFGGAYLVTTVNDRDLTQIPPKGWLSLLSIVVLSAFLGLALDIFTRSDDLHVSGRARVSFSRIGVE